MKHLSLETMQRTLKNHQEETYGWGIEDPITEGS